MAKLSTINIYEKEGGLAVLNMPLVIEEAMMVCIKLNQKYLWVDRLCIVQDDETSKHYDIKHMSAIFHNATVTIIAADSKTADSGIRGIPNMSGPRNFHQDIIQITPQKKVAQSSSRPREL